mmetsp:Transcript_28748/g.57361  ORF Transcript_28748/g.57361 Transcript_28748/m.57361 type:complete len:262 (-) Transcript_28748:784-1569(-)
MSRSCATVASTCSHRPPSTAANFRVAAPDPPARRRRSDWMARREADQAGTKDAWDAARREAASAAGTASGPPPDDGSTARRSSDSMSKDSSARSQIARRSSASAPFLFLLPRAAAFPPPSSSTPKTASLRLRQRCTRIRASTRRCHASIAARTASASRFSRAVPSSSVADRLLLAGRSSSFSSRSILENMSCAGAPASDSDDDDASSSSSSSSSPSSLSHFHFIISTLVKGVHPLTSGTPTALGQLRTNSLTKPTIVFERS